MSERLEQGLEIASRYTLSWLLGEGGMGTVWAAEDAETGETVALKFMKHGSLREDLRRRFMREARAAVSIDHPAVVEVFDIVEMDDGAPVIVMECLEGESFAERLERRGPLPLPEVARIMQTVVSAVGNAHAVGIVHRDLKPANIFLARGDSGDEEVKVLDFGIAKLTAAHGDGAASTSLTGSGTILGTPYYMAPEQLFGEKDVDHQVDIWAIGVILYEALSGVLPTRGENVGQVLKIVFTRGVEPIEEVTTDLPGDLCDAVNAMLARQRDERPADLREVLELLAQYAEAEAPSFGPAVSPPPDSAMADELQAQLASRGTAADRTALALASTVELRKTRVGARAGKIAFGAAVLVAAGAAFWWFDREPVLQLGPVGMTPVVTSAFESVAVAAGVGSDEEPGEGEPSSDPASTADGDLSAEQASPTAAPSVGPKLPATRPAAVTASTTPTVEPAVTSAPRATATPTSLPVQDW